VGDVGAGCCEFCSSPIAPGQHYLRLAALFDTAGREARTAFALPEALWSGIYDTPLCAAFGLARAGLTEEIFTDVFAR
jgi:hypothetical protein